ncbi:hypothetical protein EIP91_008348 [Steccherinum ochraceum]|uniref:non-specific serine/threonine protein kinase n=1 Tax=Steccherinum ochraceum TaxID=92696 RepID=A0A4R0RSE9_9APHY|nr:hypothetical protein EIP91_008348 [Steccherinum ochraceum]
MLGTRTKQISAYGRRGRRIVNTNDDRSHVEHISLIESPKLSSGSSGFDPPPPRQHRPNTRIVLSPSPSPRAHIVQKKLPIFKKVKRAPTSTRQEDSNDPSTSTSPQLPPKQKPASVPNQPLRQPLGVLPSNLITSPVALPVRRPKALAFKTTALKPNSAVVEVDIVTLDQSGRRVSQERRVSRSSVQANPVQQASSKPVSTKHRSLARTNVIVITDSEDEIRVVPRPKTRAPVPIVISDDSESEQERTLPIPAPQFSRRSIVVSPPTSPDDSPLRKAPPSSQSTSLDAPTSHLPPRRETAIKQLYPTQPLYHLKPAPPRSKPRQLTPIRNRVRRSAAFPAPPSPPSPTTPNDLDLSLSIDFNELEISPSARAQLQAYEKPPPAYLLPLLQECSQTTPHEFSAFIDMFPFDPIAQNVPEEGMESVGLAQFQKIGEASFSEVFGIGDVVLKVVPLRDEDAPMVEDTGECPAPSDAKDVLNEIIVTRDMGEICEGFVELLRTYIVRGKYPSLLLDLWDEYHERKGSESVRPDGFSVSQLYAIIVLPNGGPDLEAYNFAGSPQNRWRRACSIFWQVTRALSEAEELVRFEHRDLHWGQILVKTVTAQTQPKLPKGERVPMDHLSSGVKATVIDLGLARMDADDGPQRTTRWTPFEPEIFEGEGDYQFDVYRMMKVCNGDRWDSYHPLTNVMKLLHAKRIRAPTAPRKSTAASITFSEVECHQCLVEVEATLAAAVARCKPTPARKKGVGRSRKTQAVINATAEVVGLKSAAEVLTYGVGNGWIS